MNQLKCKNYKFQTDDRKHSIVTNLKIKPKCHDLCLGTDLNKLMN